MIIRKIISFNRYMLLMILSFFITGCASMKIQNISNFYIDKNTLVAIEIQHRDRMGAFNSVRNELLWRGFNVVSENEAKRAAILSGSRKVNSTGAYYVPAVLLSIQYNIWFNYNTYGYFIVEIVDLRTNEIISLVNYRQTSTNTLYPLSSSAIVKKFISSFERLQNE